MGQAITAPADLSKRNFNENDILGDFERDHKGNVVLGDADKSGKFKDNSGKETNPKGYLTNPQGDIINNLNGKKMFDKNQMSENGSLPAAFDLEKYNFNPH